MSRYKATAWIWGITEEDAIENMKYLNKGKLDLDIIIDESTFEYLDEEE